jgi:hypothetical protein
MSRRAAAVVINTNKVSAVARVVRNRPNSAAFLPSPAQYAMKVARPTAHTSKASISVDAMHKPQRGPPEIWIAAKKDKNGFSLLLPGAACVEDGGVAVVAAAEVAPGLGCPGWVPCCDCCC